MSKRKCNRCHRVLTDAASIAVGLGPTCFAKVTGKPFPRQKKQQSASKGHSSSIRCQRKSTCDRTITFDEWMEIMRKEASQTSDGTFENEQGNDLPQYEERAHSNKAVSPLKSNRIVSRSDEKSNTED